MILGLPPVGYAGPSLADALLGLVPLALLVTPAMRRAWRDRREERARASRGLP